MSRIQNPLPPLGAPSSFLPVCGFPLASLSGCCRCFQLLPACGLPLGSLSSIKIALEHRFSCNKRDPESSRATEISPRATQEQSKVASEEDLAHQNRELENKTSELGSKNRELENQNRELGNKNRELNSLSAVLVRASCPMNDRAQAKSGSWTQEMSRAAKSCRKAAQERPKSNLERHFYWLFVGLKGKKVQVFSFLFISFVFV